MKNSELLRDMIIDFIDQNDMPLEELVAVLETTKLEYAIAAIAKGREEDEEKEDNN